MELQRRNVLLITTLVLLAGIAASSTLVLVHHAKAEDAASIGIYDVQVDRHHAWVEIVFDKPIEVARPGEIVDPPPATIAPSLTGAWRWRATNILRFTPAGGFPLGSEYRITLKSARLIAAGQRFRGDGEVKVSIARLLIENITTVEERSANDPRRVILRGEVHFNAPVDPQILVTRMAVVDGNERLPIEILVDGGFGDVISFRTPPLPKGRDERTVKIVVAQGLVESEFVKEVTIGSSETLSVRGVEPFSGADESRIKSSCRRK